MEHYRNSPNIKGPPFYEWVAKNVNKAASLYGEAFYITSTTYPGPSIYGNLLAQSGKTHFLCELDIVRETSEGQGECFVGYRGQPQHSCFVGPWP